MSRTHLRQPTKPELQEKLRRAETDLDALQRWFWYVERGATPNTLDVRIDAADGSYTLIRIGVYGMNAPHGGIAVMRDVTEGYSQTPEYLDTLCARLDKDVNWELRDAARKLRAARECFIAAEQVSP